MKKTSVKEIAKHEKSTIWKSATWRECNMKNVHHGKTQTSRACKTCNMKIV